MAGLLENKVGVITGAGSGIGRTTALTFAREGAQVVVGDIDEPAGRETVELIIASGGRAAFFKTDVTCSKDVEGLVEETVHRFGRIDCAFNNAGVSHPKALTHAMPEEHWDMVININLKGVWLCMKYELAKMFEQGFGVIVNAASINGLGGWKELGGYVASKHGVIGLTRNAALEYAHLGIRVNSVCPGPVLTPLSHYQGDDPEVIKKMYPMPMERRGSMEEVAEAVVWLCSDRSSYTTGHNLVLDGGFMAQ